MQAKRFHFPPGYVEGFLGKAVDEIYRSNVIRHWDESCWRDLSVERHPALERKLSPFTLPAIRTAVGRPPSGQRRFLRFFSMNTLQVVPIQNLPTYRGTGPAISNGIFQFAQQR